MNACCCSLPYEQCCGRRNQTAAPAYPFLSPQVYSLGAPVYPLGLPSWTPTIDYDLLADKIAERLKARGE